MFKDTFARGAGEAPRSNDFHAFEAYRIKQNFGSVVVYCADGQTEEFTFASFRQDQGDLDSPLIRTYDQIGEIALAIHRELFVPQRLPVVVP